MRPPGEIRMAIAGSLEHGPAMTREVALRSGVGVSAARYTLRNMVSAGEAIVLDMVRVEGVKRPVPVYGRAVRAVDVAGDGEPFVSLIQAWASVPARQPLEAAM